MKNNYTTQVEDYGSRYGLRVKFGKENKLIKVSEKLEKSKSLIEEFSKRLAKKNNGKYLGIVDMKPKSKAVLPNSSKSVKDYSYIKRSDISVLKATIDGKVLNVDPKDILSGSYVAKKVKSTAKKIRVAKIDSSKLRDKILNYAKKFYKKEYEEKLDPVYDSKVTTDDLDKFIACGLTEEMIMAFYCGFKSIMDIKSDGEFNYGFSGGIFVFQTEGGYIERHIKRAIYNCENDVYELGFKYPTFNWKSAGMKMSKTEVITSAEYEGWRNTKKQAILKIETFKVKTNFTVLAVKDIGEVVDGKTEARYGQNELLDPKKPLDLNNDYLALVSRNGKELFSLAKKLLSQTEGYVKDFDWLVQSKTFGAEMLTESNYKFAKGGEVIFTDLSDNTQSRKEWEGRKSKNTNQNSVGSFSHKVNNRMVGSYYIYRLTDFDEKYYAHIPLKDGEILVRVETDNMVGGEMPLVKINISNGRVYFMSEDNDLNSDYDDKNPKFNKASADVLYLSLDNALKNYESYSKKINRKMQKGGSTQVMLGHKLNKNYPEFTPTIQYAGDTLSLFTVFKDEDKNWSSEAQKMIDNEKRKGRRAAVIHKGGNHGLYLKAYFEKGGSMNVPKANLGAIMAASKLAPKSFNAADTKIANKVSKKSFAERMSETGNEKYDNSTYAEGGEIKIEFEHKGNKHKHTFTPEEEDWWTSFESNGNSYDVHYDEDYGAISVYEYSDKGTDYSNTVYSKKIMGKGGSTYAEGGEIFNDYFDIDKVKSIENVEVFTNQRKGHKNYVRVDYVPLSRPQTMQVEFRKIPFNTDKELNYIKKTLQDNFAFTYAEGGGVDFDPISYAKNAGKDAIDWMQELKNYAGENYDSLTAEEKDSIISDLQMDYDFSHSFKTGGNLQKVLEKRGYDSESDINKDNMSRQEAREIMNEVDEMNKAEMNIEKSKKLIESARKRGLIK